MVPGECRESRVTNRRGHGRERRRRASKRSAPATHDRAGRDGEDEVGGTASGDRGGEADESARRVDSDDGGADRRHRLNAAALRVVRVARGRGVFILGRFDRPVDGGCGGRGRRPSRGGARVDVRVRVATIGRMGVLRRDGRFGADDWRRTARSRGEEALSATSSARSCRCRGKRGGRARRARWRRESSRGSGGRGRRCSRDRTGGTRASEARAEGPAAEDSARRRPASIVLAIHCCEQRRRSRRASPRVFTARTWSCARPTPGPRASTPCPCASGGRPF